MTSTPDKVMLWHNCLPLTHIGQWATTRYPEDAEEYVKLSALGTMVKPLEWEDHPFNGEPVISMAKSPFGTYFICDDTDDFTGLYCEFISHKAATWYGSVKASTVLICSHWHEEDHAPLQHQANTHYTAAILSTLGLVPE